jgi:hypothetical protein
VDIRKTCFLKSQWIRMLLLYSWNNLVNNLYLSTKWQYNHRSESKPNNSKCLF